MEIPIKMDDCGVPLVLETSIYALLLLCFFSGSIVKLSGRDFFRIDTNSHDGEVQLGIYRLNFYI